MLSTLLPLAQDTAEPGRVVGALLVPVLLGLLVFWLARRRGTRQSRAVVYGLIATVLFLLLLALSRVGAVDSGDPQDAGAVAPIEASRQGSAQ